MQISVDDNMNNFTIFRIKEESRKIQMSSISEMYKLINEFLCSISDTPLSLLSPPLLSKYLEGVFTQAL